MKQKYAELLVQVNDTKSIPGINARQKEKAAIDQLAEKKGCDEQTKEERAKLQGVIDCKREEIEKKGLEFQVTQVNLAMTIGEREVDYKKEGCKE